MQDPETGIPEGCWWGCWHRCWQKWGCWPECWHRCWQAGPFVNTETTRSAGTCASTPASTPIFASTCASNPASTFLEFPFRGPVPGRQGLNPNPCLTWQTMIADVAAARALSGKGESRVPLLLRLFPRDILLQRHHCQVSSDT